MTICGSILVQLTLKSSSKCVMLCYSRGFMLLSCVVTPWNYLEIPSGGYFTSLQWRLSLSLSFLWDPLEITLHFPASAAQRPVSGALVMENYQLAPMKWPLEKPLQTARPLPLSSSWFHTTTLSILFSPSVLLKPRMKCIFTTEDFCTISAFCPVKHRWQLALFERCTVIATVHTCRGHKHILYKTYEGITFTSVKKNVTGTVIPLEGRVICKFCHFILAGLKLRLLEMMTQTPKSVCEKETEREWETVCFWR